MLRRRSLAVLAAAISLVASACGASATTDAQTQPDVADWDAVVAAADGQTVRWWLYGGDDRINRYVDEHVAPAAADVGVRLERVPIADTADAVQRVVAEVQAGGSSTVDLIWINGENFALGKRSGLWLDAWADQLPNAALVAPSTVATDFGVPVDGQESPWSQALFVFAHDRDRMPQPPRDLADLLDYARAHPGRITYPAPPDFTGSAFVRQVVAAMGEDAAFAWLTELEPLLWQQGRTHPASEAELNRLFGDGEVDLAMSYDPSFVETAVRQGVFPESARPFTLANGTLHNVSYVTIPANTAHRAAALVVANLLLDPQLQARKADPEILGVPTVLDLERLDRDGARLFDAVLDSAWLLADFGPLIDELPVDRVEELERRWRDEVLP